MPKYKFGDLVYNITEKRSPVAGDEELYIGLEHLDSGSLRVTRWGSKVALKGDKLVMRKGDILFGRRNTYLRRVAIAPHDGLFSAHGMILRAKTERINSEYLPFFIASDYFMDEAIRISVGSLSPTVNWKELKELEFTIPTLEEQEKLVKTLLAANDLKEKYEELLAITDDLVKSQFIELFGDYKTNTKNWPIAKFTDFAIIDATMSTDYVRYADYPHIGIDSIEKETGVLSGYRTVKEDNVISGKYVFTSAHIIYSKIRPNLNKVALPDFEGMCSADAYPILPIAEKCDRIYLAVLMRSQFFLDYILGFSARSNMPKVNRKQVEGFTAPLPPLHLQKEFSEFFKQTDKSKFEIKKAIENTSALIKSLMQQDLTN